MRWLLLLLVGCGSPYYRDIDPVGVVWRFYGGSNDPPSIRVVDDCVAYEGKCYEGVYLPARHEVKVVWRGAWSETALCHELMHAKQWEFRRLDFLHELPEWVLVEEANNRLRENGL